MLDPLARDNTPVDAAWLVLSEVESHRDINHDPHHSRDEFASTVSRHVFKTGQRC